LNRLGGLFTSSLSLTENIEAMLRATSQMMQFDAATVFLLNEGSRELTACATYPHQDMVPHIARFVLGEGILGYAVEQLETLNIGDATHDPRFKILDESRSPRSLMVQPLATPKRVVGAMTISRQRVDRFTVLDLTKIEAGRIDLVYEEFGVESAIREVLNVLRSLAIKKEIDIASTVEPSTALLIADKNKFKQVLYNLLSNAIKFTPPSGRVAIQARVQEQLLTIAVQDSGIGIAKELQHKIFGAF